MMTVNWHKGRWSEDGARNCWSRVASALAIIVALGSPPAQAQEATEPAATQAAIQETTPGRAIDRTTRSAEKDANADAHTPTRVQDDDEPDHFRGVITKLNGGDFDLKTRDGDLVNLGLPEDVTVISLREGSYTLADFGLYVGAVAVKLEEYSPIVRDSLSWLHRGFELRFIDEELRGIALGHKAWDLTPDSIIAHGWIDDIEGRVLSIKWGPTEIEETDVETPRDVPVYRMSLGKKSQIKPDLPVVAGARKGQDGRYVTEFIFVGEDGIVPSL